MGRVIAVGCWLMLTVTLWFLLGRQIFLDDAGGVRLLSASGLWTSVLLILAPAATFLPVARRSRIPMFDAEAIAGWATLGFTITFLRPSNPPTLAQFLLFLLPLTISLSTLGTLVSYAAGFRIYRGDPRRYDMVRARRQGYLGAFFVVAVLVLHGVGTLTPTSGTFLLVIVCLAEMFWLTHATARAERVRAGNQ